MGVKELLAEAKGLPTPEQVRVAAILGAVVADAACKCAYIKLTSRVW